MWFIKIPSYVSTAFYIALGWFAPIPFAQLVRNLPAVVIALMIASGIFYILGTVIYATRCFDFFPKRFGYHEVIHLFVVAGSVAHFMMILLIVNKIGKSFESIKHFYHRQKLKWYPPRTNFFTLGEKYILGWR